MKILHITPFYVPFVGGGVVHIQKLSEHLASRNHDVFVLTTNVISLWDMGSRKCAGLPSMEVINGVKVIRVSPNDGLWGKMFDGWLKLKGGYRFLSFVLGEERLGLLAQGFRMLPTIRHILRLDADIVASMNWYCAPAYYAYLARTLKYFRMVGIPLFHTADAWSDREIHRAMLSACDAVVANTAHEADFAIQRGAKRVEVAGVGIQPNSFDDRNGKQIRERYGLGNCPVVGFVGMLIPRKGATVLLQAMKVVWAWNTEVRLVLAGSAPPGGSPVDDLIEQLTAEERARIVRITEFPDHEKASIYDAFDVFALPSASESFGIVYLEAWLCGKPVIGARIGSTQSVICEGTDGLLVEPENALDIARAIIDLLSNPDKRERLGKNGQAKILAQFTWDKVTDKVEEIYRDLYRTKASRCLSSLRIEERPS